LGDLRKGRGSRGEGRGKRKIRLRDSGNEVQGFKSEEKEWHRDSGRKSHKPGCFAALWSVSSI
jgi:hypothetical protein